MAPRVMIYIPSFIAIASGIQVILMTESPICEARVLASQMRGT
jgi:hypothetical protein